MQLITKYKATDGTEWHSAHECERRDALDAEVRALENRLGPNVYRGRKRIDPTVVAEVKKATVLLCRRVFPNEPVFQNDPDAIHPWSFAGRLIDETGGPIRRIWYRFGCMNGEWEYEQPFYALHPEEFREPAQS